MGKTLIRVECLDQRLILMSAPAIASGGRNEDEIKFSFCSLWAGFAKTAVFFRDKNAVYHVPVTDDKCVIPHEVLASEGVMYLGVFGVSGDIRRTSDTLRYYVKQGAITEGGLPGDPNSDIYKRYLDNLAEMEQATRSANTAAASAKTATASANTAAASANTAAAAANEAARLAPKPLALTQEGQPAHIWPDAGSPLRPKITMLPTQSGSGAPSPTNVRSISGRSSVRVHRIGKNLMNVDYSAPSAVTRAKAAAITGGARVTYAGASNDYGFCSWYLDIPLEDAAMVGRTFTLSCKVAASGSNTPRMRVSVYNKFLQNIGQSISADGVGNLSITYTIGSGEVAKGNRLGILFYPFETNERHAAGTYADFTDIQLEFGNTATEYEPPANVFEISFDRTVYGGTLDVNSGVLTVDRVIATLKGNEAWTRSNSWTNPYAFQSTTILSSAVNVSGYDTVADITCSHVPTKTMSSVASASGGAAVGQGGGKNLIICLGQYATAAELNAYISSQAGTNPVQICYKLANPVTVQLSPVEIAALEGLNTVYSTGEGMELTYNKSLVREHEELLARIAALEAAVVANA